MKRTLSYRVGGLLMRVTLLAIAFCVAPPARAALVNWGDLSDPTGGVVFRQVTEDNSLATTVFAPQATGPTAVGDTLHFAPTGFQSQSSGGASLIDSTLRLVVAAKPGSAITGIHFSEFGDYTLGGLPGGLANASVGATVFWRVTRLDGAPVSLPMQMASLAFTGGGAYARPGDDGTARPWSGSVLLDIASFLAGQEIGGRATAVEITLDNTLQTAADAFSNAFLKKKGVDLHVDRVVPEPAAIGILAGVFGAAVWMRRRLG